MKSITTTWTGIRPLIMSNPQTVEIANPFAVNSRRGNHKGGTGNGAALSFAHSNHTR